jgi:hypothetical protein
MTTQPHDFYRGFPYYQRRNDRGQWCLRCGCWVEPADLTSPCPGKPCPPAGEPAEPPTPYDQGRPWWQD